MQGNSRWDFSKRGTAQPLSQAKTQLNNNLQTRAINLVYVCKLRDKVGGLGIFSIPKAFRDEALQQLVFGIKAWSLGHEGQIYMVVVEQKETKMNIADRITVIMEWTE